MSDHLGGFAMPDDDRQKKFDSLNSGDPAKISLVYESKDGRFCLFSDAYGHLTAVRAEMLA